ncbi:MAG: hypothetical protein WC459_04385 [Patescibacteria group bacterium]
MPTNFLNPNNQGEKLSEQELTVSYWFLSHKELLRKILIGTIGGIAGIFLLYSLWGLIDWAFISGPKERANLKTILQIKVNPNALAGIAASNINFSEPEVFSSGVGRYDFVAKILNPNEKWWANFDYSFVGEGLSGEVKKGFVLPGETKYITELGVEKPFRPRNIRLVINNLKYHRINPHEISDYSKWRDEHLNIGISDKAFNSASVNKKDISTLSFKAANNTAYSLWSVGFYGILWRGDELVSINYLTAENFSAGETRDLQMQFYEGLPSITKYEVVPELNIFDENSFKSMK